MKTTFFLAALLFVTFGTLAQSSASSATDETDIEGERRRIAFVREREAARDAQDRMACYTRFAVNDCLLAARVRLRIVLDEVGRQEIALNDAERKRKALQQLERIKQRSSVPH